MSSVASEPALIGLDWGTSSLRAFLIGTDGEVQNSISLPQGIMHVKDRNFDTIFRKLIGPWTGGTELPIIASGMITSRNGWVETPYVNVPAGAEELAEVLVVHKTADGQTVHFVTGMTTEHDGAPDVMRGEETQIVGAAAIGMADGTFVMPGTHSKWMNVADGRIRDYTTYMTGEVFGALRSHTILGMLMTDSRFDPDGFQLGVEAGLSTGSNLLHDLFRVRTLPLFGRISGDMTADYLSGMLIGAEIAAATSEGQEPGSVTIVGRGDLSDRYETALSLSGVKCQRAPDDIAARGHYLIAKSAGLLA